jgi:hypothetical protein
MRKILALLFALFASPAAAQVIPSGPWGSINYWGQSGASFNLPPGNPGQCLTTNGVGNAPSWVNCQVSSLTLLPGINTNQFYGNVSGQFGPPVGVDVNTILNTIGYDIVRPPVPESIIYKSNVGPNFNWQTLPPGPAGNVLTSGGPSNPIFWATQTQATLTSICQTVGALLYYNTPSLAWACLNPGTAGQILQTGGASGNPSWLTLSATAPLSYSNGNFSTTTGTLTATNDTNVTVSLGGTPTNAMFNSVSLTLGWTGTLAAGRLNSNVVQSVTNDTNVTGSISAQNLTLGWTGVLSTARGGTGANLTGTSGGVPYFSSTTTMGSSAALTQNGVVIGGGAGAAPSSIAAGTNGQVLLGVTGGAPQMGTVSGDCSITNAGAITCTKNAGVPASLALGGRLTITSGVPVMVSAVANATTLYYAPYTGLSVPIYDGTNMLPHQFTSSATDNVGLSLNLASSANWPASGVFDAFVALNGGSPVLCTGPQWASSTARAATGGLVLYNGIETNASAGMTCRTGASTTISCPVNQCNFVGTFATDGTNAGQITWTPGSAAAGGGAARVVIWNAANRELVRAQVVNSTASWSYTSSTVRAPNGSATMNVTFVSGLQNDGFSGQYANGFSLAATASAFFQVGVGLDSNTSMDHYFFGQTTAAVTQSYVGTSPAMYPPQIGAHNFYALEAGDNSHATSVNGGTSGVGAPNSLLEWQMLM